MTPNQLPPLSDEQLCEVLTTAYGSPEWTMDDVRAARAIESATLAALAQQAQEPVAWLYVDTVGERYLCFSRPTGGGAITNLYATPPAPQPAPVDEREAFEAWMIHQGYGPKPRICSKGSPCEGEYANQFWELAYRAARAALQSQQPAVPVVSDEQIRKTVESIQDPDTVPAFHSGYYTLTPDELRRAILALRPAVEPMTDEVRRQLKDHP